MRMLGGGGGSGGVRDVGDIRHACDNSLWLSVYVRVEVLVVNLVDGYNFVKLSLSTNF